MGECHRKMESSTIKKYWTIYLVLYICIRFLSTGIRYLEYTNFAIITKCLYA